MFLREVAIFTRSSSQLPGTRTERDFNITAHTVQEILCSLLPPKYVLDGTRKTNIELGPRGPRDPQYAKLLNVNMYNVDDFDFNQYFSSSDLQRDEMLLSTIEAALLDIANRSNSDPEPLKKAISQTRACKGDLRYTIPSLSRMTPSRRLKLLVFRHIMHGGEDWGIDVCDRKGNVLTTRSIAKATNWYAALTSYRKPMIKGNSFLLLDRFGKTTFEIDVAALEAELEATRRLN